MNGWRKRLRICQFHSSRQKRGPPKKSTMCAGPRPWKNRRMLTKSCATSAQRWPSHKIDMNTGDISHSVRIENDIAVCEECGMTSRVGRGLCLNCLLRRGLGSDTETSETLE